MPPKKKSGEKPLSPVKLRSGRKTSVPEMVQQYDNNMNSATCSLGEATHQDFENQKESKFDKMFSMIENLSNRIVDMENQQKPSSSNDLHKVRSSKRDRSRSEDSYRSHSRKRKSRVREESDTDSDSDSDIEYDDDYTIDRAFGGTVGDSIKPKLRKRILAGKFVELHELLPNNSTKKHPEFVFKTSSLSHQPTIVKNNNRSISSFGEWQEAMNTLSSIEIERAKTLDEAINLSKGLLTYRNQVAKLKILGYDWLNFDRHFRMQREIKRFPWESMRQDLMLQYQPRVQQALDNTNQYYRNNSLGRQGKHINQRKQSNIPNGFCFAFHNPNAECKESKHCKYEHKCFKCKAELHPAYKCQQNNHTS